VALVEEWAAQHPPGAGILIHPEHADPGPTSRRRRNDLARVETGSHFQPVFPDLALVPIVRGNIVENNQASWPHERAIHLKIAFDSLITVVAVDEEKVQWALTDHGDKRPKRFLAVGVGSQ
jgi:hypothetical protein